MPKISVLIPVYNVSSYLGECLDSVINQSERDIEIICVEDASTDDSLKILEEYAAKDKRIIIITHKENKGLCQTRKDAVKIAQGEYIMFVDSDDYLTLDACEKLYWEISHQQVDILQFGTELIANDNVSNDMIEWTTKFMEPSLDRLEGDELLKEITINHKFNCNLVNKIWDAACCKKAYGKISDGFYTAAEDRYATFIITYYAKSYVGIKEPYYHYRMGVGVTGGVILDIKQFENRCGGARVVENVWDFLKSEHQSDNYLEEFHAFRCDILLDCIDCWHNKLDKKNQKIGYEILLQYWGKEAVVGVLAQRYFEEQKDILMRCKGVSPCHTAIYYRYVGYKAMDDILQCYIRSAEQMGEVIYLITDQDAPEMGNSYWNYPLFHIKAATDSNWDQYQTRCSELLDCLTKNNIQKIYYLSPTSHVQMLDELVAYSAQIKCSICMDEYAVDIQNKLLEKCSQLTKQNAALSNKLIAIENSRWYKLFRKIQSVTKEH